MEVEKITIVQVIYKNIYWVIWNLGNTLRINKRINLDIILIDNDNNWRHAQNFVLLKIFFWLKKIDNYKLIKNIPENLKFRGSKQHASALDLAGRFVETDLVIVSDPDCLMIKTEWISYLVNFIKEGGFDLVGTPEAYSPLNVYSRNGIMAYKFISPIPFLLFGKTQVIFLQSFMPDETTNFKLDTGYKLANDCLDGNVKFKLLQAFSTRSNTSEIFFLRNFSCTFYRFGSRNSGIWCVHFGRGSNRFGKNRSEFNLFTRIIKAYFDPLSFRHKISKFIKLTA